MAPAHRFLILDACVLIDYCNTDQSILALACRHVGQIHVATPVLEEVEQLDPGAAESLGLALVEPPLDLAAAAAGQRGPLSFQDRLCLLLARENGWTCVSNDGRLRQACRDERVGVLWGLELLALVVESGALPASEAAEIARAIHDCNKFITRQVLQRFLQRIGIRSR